MPVVIGAGGSQPEGTFAEYIVVDRHEVLETPTHLDDVHAAAWPLGGLTAWRWVSLVSSLPVDLI
jgi:NADPH:quinone reductase-like Zn-dependent oxidoreductase